MRTWDLLLNYFLTCRLACIGVVKTNWLYFRAGNTAEGISLSHVQAGMVVANWTSWYFLVLYFRAQRGGNTATGIFLPCAESVLNLYRRWLEFGTSGKGCFTHCSKTREVGGLKKKLKVEKTEEERAGMRESGLKYLPENLLATSPWQQFSINDYPPFTTSRLGFSLPVLRVRVWVRVRC